MIRRLERLDAAGLLQSAILDLRRLGPLERERCLEWWRDALGASWEKTEDELARLMDADGYLAATSAFRRSQHWRTKGFERLGTAVLSASQPAFRQWNWIASTTCTRISICTNCITI